MSTANDDSPHTFRTQIWDGARFFLYDNGSQQALAAADCATRQIAQTCPNDH